MRRPIIILLLIVIACPLLSCSPKPADSGDEESAASAIVSRPPTPSAGGGDRGEPASQPAPSSLGERADSAPTAPPQSDETGVAEAGSSREESPQVFDHPDQEPPAPHITLDGQALDYRVGMNYWNGWAIDRDRDTLQAILGEGPDAAVPYFPLGGTIEILFPEDPPDRMLMYNHIVDERGNNLYPGNNVFTLVDQDGNPYPGYNNIQVQLEDGYAAVPFAAHPAYLDDPAADAGGRQYRGFQLRCIWENGNDCEIGFVILSDAQ